MIGAVGSVLLLALMAPLQVGAQQGSVRPVTLKSKALEGNLLGDPAEQRFAVYTPPGYDSGIARYPVIYLLHGIGDSYETWLNAFKVDAMLDRLIGSKQIAPVILVLPNAGNRFLGSYYLNSPVSGRWADYIANEIVATVDERFRTIRDPNSRAVIGHSMGGFGAIGFGMTRPDVFSVVYAMSPCCLDAVEDVGMGNVSAWTKALTFKTYEDADAALKSGDFYPAALIAFLSATSPKPGAPLNVDFPIKRQDRELIQAHPAYEKWLARFPVHAVPSHRDNLLKLRLLAFDVGFDDQFAHIPPATLGFSRALSEQRIPHRLETYDGDHRQKVPERMEKIVFPMVAGALAR